ncbi:MAG: TIGR01777 family oxidoreductase [Pirellulales bacterium]
MPEFVYRSPMPCSADELCAWHLRPGAFERLAPPWERVVVEQWAEPHEVGRQAILRTRLAPGIWKRWVAEYREFTPGRLFRDVQVSGPFARFDHRHIFEPASETTSWLEDRIDYAPPGGWLGQALGGGWVRRSLEQLFAYRHRTTADDLAALSGAGHPRLRVLISGASGLVGSSLVPFLTAGGHDVTRLVRPGHTATGPSLPWESLEGPSSGGLAEPPFDAVVHLAGEGIANGRWTAKRKQRIRDSRVEGTHRLCSALARLPTPPAVLVSTSAVGFYGNQGDRLLEEDQPAGDDFLAQVCRDWEQATQPAVAAGIRVVQLRYGVILSGKGGALTRMLPPFRLGIGGPLGNGRQYLSWIALDDVLSAIAHAMTTQALSGPVNVVAPEAVTNTEFSRTLGRVLRRPAVLPLPATAARLALGELADALLLASQRVVPVKLVATGFRFRYSDLEEALRYQLGRILIRP